MEAPRVARLPAEVEVELGDEEPVAAAAERGRARRIGAGHVARPVKVAKVGVRRAAVARGECSRKDLGADAVDRGDKVAVGDGGVARLDAPERLRERADGRRGVEDDLGAVERKGEPVERVVAPANFIIS